MMISIGFGVFVFSEFSLTRNLGWLTSSIMIVCVIADITLLGSMLAGRDWRELTPVAIGAEEVR